MGLWGRIECHQPAQQPGSELWFRLPSASVTRPPASDTSDDNAEGLEEGADSAPLHCDGCGRYWGGAGPTSCQYCGWHLGQPTSLSKQIEQLLGPGSAHYLPNRLIKVPPGRVDRSRRSPLHLAPLHLCTLRPSPSLQFSPLHPYSLRPPLLHPSPSNPPLRFPCMHRASLNASFGTIPTSCFTQRQIRRLALRACVRMAPCSDVYGHFNVGAAWQTCSERTDTCMHWHVAARSLSFIPTLLLPTRHTPTKSSYCLHMPMDMCMCMCTQYHTRAVAHIELFNATPLVATYTQHATGTMGTPGSGSKAAGHDHALLSAIVLTLVMLW